MTVSLRPMTPEEFDVFLEHETVDYAEDRARANAIPIKQARAEAEDQLARLLPRGRDTPGHTFWIVLDDDSPAGRIWLGPHSGREQTAYIYDIAIDEQLRGRGIGRAALEAVDQVVRDAGLSAIGLNVFGFNAGAQHLYATSGYEVVATQMLKQL